MYITLSFKDQKKSGVLICRFKSFYAFDMTPRCNRLTFTALQNKIRLQREDQVAYRCILRYPPFISE